MIDFTPTVLQIGCVCALLLPFSPATASFAQTTPTAQAIPASLSTGATGVAVALAGTGTAWDSQTRFAISGGTGARIASQSIIDATHATLIVYPGAQAGDALLMITDTTDAAKPMLTVTAPTINSQVVCHGDSLTRGENASQGLGTATGTTYPGILASALGPSWKVTNVGTGGWTIDQMQSEAPAKVDALFDPNLRENILIVFGGTNNIGGARQSADAVYAKLTAYCAARRKAHPWKILVVAAPVAAYPRVYPPDFDAVMLSYGAMTRKNWRQFANGLIDVQSDARLGIPGAEFNPAYFNARDFTHLTDTGYAIVGNYAAEAVFALVAKGSADK